VTVTTIDDSVAPGGEEVRPVRPSRLRRALLPYAVSRLLTIFVAVVVAIAKPGISPVGFLAEWDGIPFLDAVHHGYPAVIPQSGGHVLGTTIPFFPLYPLSIRFVAWLLPVSDPVAGILISLMAGALGAVLIHRLTERIAGPETADRAALLFAFFPGSLVLSMVYSEGITIALAAGCLLALLDRRWLIAGLCAGLASATRITALALVLPCLWEAASAIRYRRDWGALVAPALAPVGTAAYMVYLWVHTGDLFAYSHAQQAWGQGQGFAPGTRAGLVLLFSHPLQSELVVSLGVCLVFALVAGAILLKARWPGMISVYAISVVAFSIAFRADGLRPRDLLLAFPLVTGLATVLENRRLRIVIDVFAGLLLVTLFLHNLRLWTQP
jgi:hypothetical protein